MTQQEWFKEFKQSVSYGTYNGVCGRDITFSQMEELSGFISKDKKGLEYIEYLKTRMIYDPRTTKA